MLLLDPPSCSAPLKVWFSAYSSVSHEMRVTGPARQQDLLLPRVVVACWAALGKQQHRRMDPFPGYCRYKSIFELGNCATVKRCLDTSSRYAGWQCKLLVIDCLPSELDHDKRLKRRACRQGGFVTLLRDGVEDPQIQRNIGQGLN